MKNNEILLTGESASAPTRWQANLYDRILVVDDDADIRQASADVLRRCGYQTDTAADGAAAWEALQAKSYDLLITDNHITNFSGVELVKKVRSAHMTLPVILTSRAFPIEELDRNPWLQPIATLAKPFATGQLLETCYWRICVRAKWLAKPFTSDQLLETVNEVLARPTVSAASGRVLRPVRKEPKGSATFDRKRLWQGQSAGRQAHLHRKADGVVVGGVRGTSPELLKNEFWF